MAIGRYTGRETGGNPGFPAGVKNGKIPTSLLRRLETQPQMPEEEQWLFRDAAIGLDAMVRAAEKDGVKIRLHEAYRTYARQQYFWNLYLSGEGNLAARPGTSNHGLGVAIDVNRKADAKALPWMRVNARRFGWDLPDVLGRREPWHYQWIRGFPVDAFQPAEPETPVYVHGELVPGAFYSNPTGGAVLVFLRPTAEALGYEVAAQGLRATLEADDGNTLQLNFQKTADGRGILPVKELCQRLSLECVWDSEKKAVRIQ